MRVRVLPWAPFQCLRSSVERVADYESAGRRRSAKARHHEVRSRFGTAAGAATPAGDAICNAPVAQRRGHRFKPGVSVSAILTGSALARVVQQQRQPLQTRPSAGATPAMGTTQCSRSSMYRAPRFERGGWRRKSFRECQSNKERQPDQRAGTRC